jgi:hypothetical protein
LSVLGTIDHLPARGIAIVNGFHSFAVAVAALWA